MYKEIVNIELRKLRSNLKKGDEVITEISPGGIIMKHSKKVGDARMAFMILIQGLIQSGSLTTDEASKATQLFGKKTTNLFWIKD